MNKRLLFAMVAWGMAAPALAESEIRLWHAMGGAQGAEFEKVAARFNASQAAYRVTPEFKGNDGETLAASLAERRAQAAPHLVQVDEAGAADLLALKGAVRPVWQVMAEARQRIETKYLPAIAASFSDSKGRLLALPLNAATPVLYYNRDAFRRAKLDPANALKYWWGMADTLGALIDSGQACALTTSSPSWILLENMSAWHNQPFATMQNGMAGKNPRLAFNSHLMVRWVSQLSSWQKAGYFTYAGRENEAEARFSAGECAMLTASSSRREALARRSAFDVAVAPLPYYEDIAGAPQNTLVGGAGLWILAGRPKADYAGVARFLAYLSKADVQADWHQRTGYVALTQAAYELTRAKGYYATHPGQEVAMRQLLRKVPTKDSRAIRIGGLARIRVIINEELESVWSERKTPMDALNSAVARGNEFLSRPKAR